MAGRIIDLNMLGESVGIGKLLDRTAVLFIGIAVGASIGQAFASNNSEATLPDALPVAAANAAPATAVRTCPTQMGLSPRLIAAIREDREIHIGVFGDSFGDGLWAGLYNELRPQKLFTVHRFAKQATGFTRYRSINLLEDAREKLAGQPVDLAVVSFGANDTQDIYEDGKLMAYMGDDWRQHIGTKVRDYIAELRQGGASVVWVGLPRMREAKFDAQVQQMNGFYADLMCDLNIPFIDTLPKSVDGQGAYTEYLPRSDGREPIKARADDGIHMSMTGYRLLISDLTDSIRDLAPRTTPSTTPSR
ncbi:DUF459 domain-containing protein [Sphingomonas lacunae]|uniref:DUF459 domain-containing protein n=1 Tax=Sphingomonas lacunae TaxID=2698828 RepID=A0A6M4AS24_9SPHN|nr:GDSL-type esterase/lipase family protein [Sphingomonas lacunae]QJQ31210.1 DUF459 domain-containing protein [Sphingomonas lacunae]